MIIRYTKESLKFLNKLEKKSVERIRNAVVGLTLNPPIGDIKSMQGSKDERLRLRVGNWRIIFKYCSDQELEVLLVLEIGNRGDIYK